MHERILTTMPKAKELRKVVDRMITLGKRGDIHSRRLAAGFLFSDEAVAKVFSNLAKRFEGRAGGYTRIMKGGIRVGDNAQKAVIEFVDFGSGAEKSQKTPKSSVKSDTKASDKKAPVKKSKSKAEA